MQRPSRAWLVAALCLAATVFTVWSNSLGGGPLFDDHFMVVGNGCFRSWEGIRWTLTPGHPSACSYRPLRYLSYGVDVGLLGDSYRSIHVGNVVRHILASFAGLFLAARLRSQADGRDTLERGDLWFGLIAAAFWAIHPVQADSVSYMSGRRDILVGLWVFVSTHALIVAWRRGGVWWAVGVVSLALAFASKESAVVAPAAALLWVIWVAQAGEWRRSLAEFSRWWTGVAFVVTVTGLIVVWQIFVNSRSLRGIFDWWGGTPITNAATAFVLQLRAVGLVIGASPLIGDYHAHTIELPTGFGDPRALAGVAIVVVAVGAAIGFRSRARVATFAMLLWLVALLPTSHLVPHHELFAEHYLYVALLGPSLMVACGFEWAWKRFDDRRAGPIALTVVTLATLITAGARTYARNLDYRSEQAFNERVLSLAPSNTRALANLMYIYMEAGRHEDASLLCVEMTRYWIAGADQQRSALVACIDAGIRAERYDVAEFLAEELAEDHPEFGRGHRRLAELARGRGDVESALAAAIRWAETTGSSEAIAMIGDALAAGGELDGAEERSVVALASIEGISTPLRLHVASGLARGGRWEAALTWTQSATLEDVPVEARPLVCEVYRRTGASGQPPWCQEQDVPPR